MSDTMTFELVSPEKKLASSDAHSVTIPGIEGELTAMPNHSAFLTTLRPGFVTVAGVGGKDAEKYFVTGGFAEISNNMVSVLAELAAEAASVDTEWLDARISEAEKAYEESADVRKQAAKQRLDDFVAAKAQL